MKDIPQTCLGHPETKSNGSDQRSRKFLQQQNRFHLSTAEPEDGFLK
jgi:hypothetical protein